MTVHSNQIDADPPAPAEEPEIRRRADAERNLARIIESATTLLAVNPGASMAEIAEASGLVRATLYRHFPTRDDLIRAMYAAALDDALKAILSVNPEQGKATDAIARMVDALLVVGDRYRILSEERRGYPELRDKEESVGAPDDRTGRAWAAERRAARRPAAALDRGSARKPRERGPEGGRARGHRSSRGRNARHADLPGIDAPAAPVTSPTSLRQAAGDHLRGVQQPAETARVLEPALLVDDQRSGPVLEARLQRMLGEPRDERGREELAAAAGRPASAGPTAPALVQARALELHLAARAGVEPRRHRAGPTRSRRRATNTPGNIDDARLDVDDADREVVRRPARTRVVVGAPCARTRCSGRGRTDVRHVLAQRPLHPVAALAAIAGGEQRRQLRSSSCPRHVARGRAPARSSGRTPPRSAGRRHGSRPATRRRPPPAGPASITSGCAQPGARPRPRRRTPDRERVPGGRGRGAMRRM